MLPTLPYRVFLVDDDIDLLMLLERRLQAAGYAVETAASIAEAEELRHAFRPHLYLVDININGEDGRTLCWKIKMQEGDAGIKVLLITGYDCHRGRAALFGADEVLAKPVPTDYLLMRLQFHLGRLAADQLR
ncbi:response regulator [Flaviaesturariibacter flavus]|uniref:Response regulator n=1 Tax=Flaviaesturariibacter flavus TaxID=2502780 RepID=A0A4R1B4U0_9BACT|nr:response regulator [Flaviaesturariibacter flavus]TCJ13132.1 response regulator [Flaviaesturariibacter flavus]